MKNAQRLLMTLVIAGITLYGQNAIAQGCVAAHSNQRVIDGLLDSDTGGSVSPTWYHNLTVNIGYRVFNSNKYFVGTNELPKASATENHQNIFDVGLEYRLSHRLSLIADIPVFNGTRSQKYPPTGIYSVSGLGDITVGLQSWVLRPPTENGGNVAVSASLKIPTGLDNAMGSGVSKGQTIVQPVDQSMQPGDGGWGVTVATQAYKTLWHTASAYGQASYLSNPKDTNGVSTGRTTNGLTVMSVADQYLYRLGLTQGVPKVKGLALSMGMRGEGVPAHDLIGGSDGFRRPGFILSVDPGLMYNFRHDTLTVNGPWAIHRNRMPSAPEIVNKSYSGDAFFADYTVVASISHHF